MSFAVAVSPEPRRYLQKLDHQTQQRFLRKLHDLSKDPFLHTKALRGLEGLRSARVGGWRVIFTVDVGAREISIDHIGPRGQVYRDL